MSTAAFRCFRQLTAHEGIGLVDQRAVDDAVAIRPVHRTLVPTPVRTHVADSQPLDEWPVTLRQQAERRRFRRCVDRSPGQKTQRLVQHGLFLAVRHEFHRDAEGLLMRKHGGLADVQLGLTCLLRRYRDSHFTAGEHSAVVGHGKDQLPIRPDARHIAHRSGQVRVLVYIEHRCGRVRPQSELPGRRAIGSATDGTHPGERQQRHGCPPAAHVAGIGFLGPRTHRLAELWSDGHAAKTMVLAVIAHRGRWNASQ